MKDTIIKALKEAGRLIVLAVISYILTNGVVDIIVQAIAGEHLTPEIKLQMISYITLVLKAADKFIHEYGKENNIDTLTKGITRF